MFFIFIRDTLKAIFAIIFLWFEALAIGFFLSAVLQATQSGPLPCSGIPAASISVEQHSEIFTTANYSKAKTLFDAQNGEKLVNPNFRLQATNFNNLPRVKS